jgi:hypothetical protein
VCTYVCRCSSFVCGCIFIDYTNGAPQFLSCSFSGLWSSFRYQSVVISISDGAHYTPSDIREWLAHERNICAAPQADLKSWTSLVDDCVDDELVVTIQTIRGSAIYCGERLGRFSDVSIQSVDINTSDGAHCTLLTSILVMGLTVPHLTFASSGLHARHRKRTSKTVDD